MTFVVSSVFLNPNSIFFLPYLFSGILITILWLRLSRGTGIRASLQILFDPDVWWTRQTAVDLFCSLFVLLVISRVTARLDEMIFGVANSIGSRTLGLPEFHLPPVIEGILLTIVVMIAYDFSSYGMHRLMHQVPILWRVHGFHHSAEKLSFLTTYRQHPLEPVILGMARSCAAALSIIAFHCIFPAGAQVITVLGLGAGFFLYMFTVNLHHSSVPIRYPGVLRRILISPHVHHWHHSADKQNINYGVIFSFWDRWFGTYFEDGL